MMNLNLLLIKEVGLKLVMPTPKSTKNYYIKEFLIINFVDNWVTTKYNINIYDRNYV